VAERLRRPTRNRIHYVVAGSSPAADDLFFSSALHAGDLIAPEMRAVVCVALAAVGALRL
jgi:hypothetical protein